MNKIEFFTLYKKDGVIGVKRQSGHEMKINGITIYFYELYYQSKIYFIDPETGIAVHQIDEIHTIDDIECSVNKNALVAVEKLKEAREKEAYSTSVKIFKKYLEARLFHERNN